MDAETFFEVIFKLLLLGVALVVVFGLALWSSGKRTSDKSQKSKISWIPPWEDSEEFEESDKRWFSTRFLSSASLKKSPKRTWRDYESWNQNMLNQLEWKRFEQVVSHYYKLRGFRSKVTRMGADGGVDVVLYEEQSQNPHTLIQCKSWSQKVGVKPVRELFGVMAADGIKKGIFATTSDYTGEARQWTEGKSIQLLSGASIVGMFNGLETEQIKDLLKVGLEGDFRTPTCPNCDVKMVERTARKGKSVGSSFWGCRNYPRCKQTFKVT